MRNRVLGRVAAGAALVVTISSLSAPAQAASQEPTVLAGHAASTPLNTWANLYDWPAGHGYFGWDEESAAAAGDYSHARGIDAEPGLWTWPTGDRRYVDAGAGWSYSAPGPTRILRADVRLDYPPRLLSHHCVRVALLAADGSERDSVRFCKPPGPPEGEGDVLVKLGDPAADPLARRVVARIESNACQKPNPDACDHHIPAASAEKNGLRVRVVDMTLVDDDLPTATPSGEWRDLHDRYVNGQGTHGIVLAASDAGSGVKRAVLEEPGAGELLSAPASCDPAHQTEALANRVCPVEMRAPLTVDARPIAEGRHTYREVAYDLAGNSAASESWWVFVDRTAPSPPANVQLTFFEEEVKEGSVMWDVQDDPALADGSPGSGFEKLEVRHRINGRPFTEWSVPNYGNAGLDFRGGKNGDTLTVELRATDRVGNVSAPAVHTFKLQPVLPPEGVMFGRLTGSEEEESDAGPMVAARSLAIKAPKWVPSDMRGCAVNRTHSPEEVEAGGEPKAAFNVDFEIFCRKPNSVFSKVTLKVCMQVQLNQRWQDYDFRGEDDCTKRTIPMTAGTFLLPAGVKHPCYPGTHNVRVYYRLDGVYIGGRKETDRAPGLKVEELNCNEAGAWRVMARRAKSPGTALGNALFGVDDDPPGAPGDTTERKGFHAHHLVAATQTTAHAPRAQALAYSCPAITPNGARNGAWLRGGTLYKAGEGNPPKPANSSGYNALPAEGKRRAYHNAIHTTVYFDWTYNRLEDAVLGNFRCDDDAAVKILKGIKDLVEDNRAPFGGLPGSPPPAGQD